jgi:3-phenylpropionate/cinnamic acid dioxygenase small subunit
MLAARARREVQYEVEQFLYGEAWLLDERQFAAWLALFADDARYYLAERAKVQARGGGTAAEQVLYDDDKAFLALRVQRLATHLAHSERPASVTRHLITNVQVGEAEGDEVPVRSTFVVHQERLETDDYTFYGKREDRLRQGVGGWQIVRRRVVLDHVHLPRVITIFF